VSLRQSWELRNSAAETLIKVECRIRDEMRAATLPELVALFESFSSARSPGPEWTRSFDGLVEHVWTWCDPQLIAAMEQEFRGRGPAWAAVANALLPEYGERARARLERPPVPSRVPPFSLG